MHGRLRVYWIAGAAAVLVAAAAAFWWFRPISVEVVAPARGTAVQAVYATGTVEPTIMMPIAPRIGARIVELRADEGDVVKKGQMLARLENTDMQNALAQLQAQADFARRDYARDAALVKQGAIAPQVYDKAKAAYESAVAAVAAARAQADYMVLTAPNDGRIIQRDGEVGQFIPINQPVFWLSVQSPLRISAEVDEEDVSLVAPGQKVLIRADAFEGQTFEGTVTSVTPKGDPIARSYRVRIAFARTAPLQIGMTAETNIVTREKKNALLIPASAVSNKAVWKVAGGRLVHQSVVIGVNGTE